MLLSCEVVLSDEVCTSTLLSCKLTKADIHANTHMCRHTRTLPYNLRCNMELTVCRYTRTLPYNLRCDMELTSTPIHPFFLFNIFLKPLPPHFIVGPALGQAGLNIMAFCKEFNAKTTGYKEGVPLRVNIQVSTLCLQCECECHKSGVRCL